jgi:nucleoside triphosphate diphosphatase
MTEQPNTPLDRLIAIMARLRDPFSGCEWDRAQDFASIAPYTIEEAYEVADAIQREDMEALRDELGDLLLQVVFHARMAEEAGHFAFQDVASAISEKLEARHPHIFGGAADDGQVQSRRWEALKAAERAAKGATSALDGVALALPALMRAEKLQKRAARLGFDWPDTDGPSDKVREEMAELAAAPDTAARTEEAGDLLFAAVNLVRKQGVAPEDALRAANAKFEARFRAMEGLATERGLDFASLDLEAQDDLWREVKAREPARGERSTAANNAPSRAATGAP